MGIIIHRDLIQGTPEWHEVRRGILTASEMKNIITPGKLQPAKNDKQRAHVYELLAQRITGYVEPQYISDDMLRGHADEIEALAVYAEHYAPIEQVGFITNDSFGFTLGYSPDALVGENGTVEVKSRRQKYQVQTILADEMPDEYLIQVQTGLLVSGRRWCDFVSYCGGMPMYVKRIEADPVVQEAIMVAAQEFETAVNSLMMVYNANISRLGLIPTERKIEQEMYIGEGE